MKKSLLILFIILVSSALVAQKDQRLAGVEADMEKILEATKAAGFAVAIVEKDKVIYSKGFGFRDYENKVPVDGNTLFAIGSSTKAFTSAILGQLRQEEKLSLDDSPRKYVENLQFESDELNNQIIIKDLMSHRTGIPRHDFSWYFFPTHDKDELIERIQYQEAFTGVREQWYYNNFMFLLQGVIAQRITGKSWEDNIKERFFDPLGMTRSNATIEEMKKSSNASIGYELKKGDKISKMDYYDIAAMSPAGSINSSVNDMSKWLITWINEGKFGEEQIIPIAYLTEAMSPQMVMGGGFPSTEVPDVHFANYGYGWFLSSYKGHYRVEHGGNIDGFSANVAFFPTDSIGIVVLSNQNGSAVPSLARNTLADRMLKTERTTWTEKFVERRDKAKKESEEMKDDTSSGKMANTRPSHNLVEYTGTYSHPGYGDFELKVENDSLFAHFKLEKVYFRHFHYDVFESFRLDGAKPDTSASLLKVNFQSNETGDISSASLKIEPTLDPLTFKRSPSTIKVDAESLEKYVGDYEISGNSVKIYTKNGNTLYAYVEGQPEYELLATGKHKFTIKILEGFKVEFIEGEDQHISELLMIQPQGTFKATRK